MAKIAKQPVKPELYKIEEVNADRFFQVPKELFYNPYYQDVNSDAKLIYAMLLDRKKLSEINNWVNTEGEIYLIYTRKDIGDMLNISKNTVTKAMQQLGDKGLVWEQRQGLNKPNLIYIGKIKYANIHQARRKQGKSNSGTQETQELGGINTICHENRDEAAANEKNNNEDIDIFEQICDPNYKDEDVAMTPEEREAYEKRIEEIKKYHFDSFLKNGETETQYKFRIAYENTDKEVKEKDAIIEELYKEFLNNNEEDDDYDEIPF